MANPRTTTSVTIETSIFYQVKIKKADLMQIGQGRFADGRLAPNRLFKTWDAQSLYKRELTIKTNASAPQVLIPVKVDEEKENYVVTGFLLPASCLMTVGNFVFDEQKELEKFMQHNQFKKLDENLYEFSKCQVEINFLRNNFFVRPENSCETESVLKSSPVLRH